MLFSCTRNECRTNQEWWMSCFYGLCVYIKMENQTLAGRVVNGHVFKEKKNSNSKANSTHMIYKL